MYVSTNVHDLVFWHALALLIKGITSFVEHPIALKNQSYTSQVLYTFQGSCLLNSAILADRRWAGSWQITLYIN